MSHIPFNFSAGSATLSGGEKGVANTRIAATSEVFVSNNGASGTLGVLSVSLSAGSGFVINSANILDDSTVSYFIIY